jgi:serine/threonine protein kinase
LATEFSRGTASYRAPELLTESPTFSDRVDIWALGCILHELAFKRRAFVSDWAITNYALMKQRLFIPLRESEEPHGQTPLVNLIHELLQIKPKDRPSAKDLCHLLCILIDAGSKVLTQDNDNLLLSRICQPLFSEERKSDEYLPVMYAH